MNIGVDARCPSFLSISKNLSEMGHQSIYNGAPIVDTPFVASRN